MALPLFISDAELVDSVKAAVGLQPGDTLSGEWSTLITNANRSATDDIYSRLGIQGFLSDTIQSWDAAPDYARDLGTFWALTRAAGLGGYSAPNLKTLDRREELDKKTVLFVDGVAVAPTAGESAVGGITHGVSTPAMESVRRFNCFAGGFGFDRRLC